MTVQSVEVKLLRPTQIAVGKRLVKTKRKGLRAREHRPSELVNFILENPIRVVAGPAKQLFVVDHHHLAHALLDEGFETAPVVFLGDLSKTPRGKFWAEMKEKGWVHPFDGKGRKRPISAIPRKIKDMEDDPYRSLAGFVRLRGGFIKSETPFAEFLWADFYRSRIALKLLKKNFTKGFVEALEFSSSPDAAHLPGYISAQKSKKTAEAQ
jgi:hypothetical protein